jgi:hypothetical protein
VIITLPTPLELTAILTAFLAAHPMLVLVFLLVAVVVWPAVWSRRPERRCAGAAVLAKLVDGVVAVVQAFVAAGAWPARPTTA